MAAGTDLSPLIVIIGETASGKSELAMLLAEKVDGEIIAADSWTVYKGFDIGTAKPSKVDRKRVPHYLLDIADPKVGFSAAEYKRQALAAISDIAARGRVPILVGGTGLYVDSVVFDFSFLPKGDPMLRAQLSSMALSELLERIAELELDAGGIDIRNKRRVIRLIENNGVLPTKSELRSNTLLVGLSISPELLRSRVLSRIDEMFAAGLEDEVHRLAMVYGWEVEPMKGIGYREFREYFSGSQTLHQTRDRIVSDSLNLAKRQRTWFKRNNRIHWIDKQAEVVGLVTTFLNK